MRAVSSAAAKGAQRATNARMFARARGVRQRNFRVAIIKYTVFSGGAARRRVTKPKPSTEKIDCRQQRHAGTQNMSIGGHDGAHRVALLAMNSGECGQAIVMLTLKAQSSYL